jgi:heptosyltransferase-2
MTTPALQRLRERFPRAQIALLTHEKLAGLWMRHSDLNEVLTFTAQENPWSIARRLRAKNFDLALVLPNSPRSALEVWWARIPQRIGYARPWRSFFLSETVTSEEGRMKKRTPGQIRRVVDSAAPEKSSLVKSQVTQPNGYLAHHVQVYLRLVRALGARSELLAPRLIVGDDELRKAQETLLAQTTARTGSEATSTPVWMGLNPSAAYGPAKRWPAENFATAVREISLRVGECRWIAFGGPEDVLLCDEIATQAGVKLINLAGKTSLRELMGLLKLCRVLLTNDSGPMHVAAALGTTVVVPFGSTSPELTAPGLPGNNRHFLLKANAPCSPCFRRTCPIDLRCMTGISVEQVVESCLLALKMNGNDTA